MSVGSNSPRAEAKQAVLIEKVVEEYDSLGERIYPVVAVTMPMKKGIEVDLRILEELAAKFESPHFAISNYELERGAFREEVKDWRFHFTYIPAGLIIAHEKIEE